jgi:hypothetical protein
MVFLVCQILLSLMGIDMKISHCLFHVGTNAYLRRQNLQIFLLRAFAREGTCVISSGSGKRDQSREVGAS